MQEEIYDTPSVGHQEAMKLNAGVIGFDKKILKQCSSISTDKGRLLKRWEGGNQKSPSKKKEVLWAGLSFTEASDRLRRGLMLKDLRLKGTISELKALRQKQTKEYWKDKKLGSMFTTELWSVRQWEKFVGVTEIHKALARSQAEYQKPWVTDLRNSNLVSKFFWKQDVLDDHVLDRTVAVSYTHLTLPTIYSV
eukprot:TRINITY_DN8938_c0_g1_i1.p1 TRINITY_DN8938_c0_g1~~TRINITY_DN8938_c0_g1_i1.p1  ORF type:complete len:194 (-),score=31.08 TRINITY_DN8938_c0_g1_i1:36-617(-)